MPGISPIDNNVSTLSLISCGQSLPSENLATAFDAPSPIVNAAKPTPKASIVAETPATLPTVILSDSAIDNRSSTFSLIFLVSNSSILPIAYVRPAAPIPTPASNAPAAIAAPPIIPPSLPIIPGPDLLSDLPLSLTTIPPSNDALISSNRDNLSISPSASESLLASIASKKFSNTVDILLLVSRADVCSFFISNK